MKREVWLAANRRAILFGMIAPLFLLLVGGLLLASGRILAAPGSSWASVGFAAGTLLIILGILIFISLLIMYCMPRLAYHDRHLLVYLGTAQPYRVPIELVEVFFLGQAASGMPNPLWEQGKEPSESTTVVVRIAEAAKEWQKRDVRPVFGHWCDGYIIVRGTWSEPITGEVVMELNRKLVECHRAIRQEKESAPGDRNEKENDS